MREDVARRDHAWTAQVAAGSGTLNQTQAVANKVDELMKGASPYVRPANPQPPTYHKDSAFSYYRNLDSSIIEFFRDFTLEISLGVPPHKSDLFTEFTLDNRIPVPADFALLPESKTAKWNLSGYIKIKWPEDEERLHIFSKINPNLGDKFLTDKVSKSDDGESGYAVDTKLELALMVVDPDRFRITRYPRLDRRRGPRKSLEEVLV